MHANHAYHTVFNTQAGESLLGGNLRSHQVATIQRDVSFDDVLDAVNPLNQIPVLSSLSASGEPQAASESSALSPIAKLVGGGLLGGVFGLVGAVFDLMFEEATGASVVGSVAKAVMSDENTASSASLASAKSSGQTGGRFYTVTPALQHGESAGDVDAAALDLQI